MKTTFGRGVSLGAAERAFCSTIGDDTKQQAKVKNVPLIVYSLATLLACCIVCTWFLRRVT
jgi:hypothetical protein